VHLFDDRARRWFFYGQGRSGLVAQMAAMRFMHLGYKAHFVGEVSAPSIRQGDGLLLVSGSGETPVLLNFATIAKQEGANIAVVTGHETSSLARLADKILSLPLAKSTQFGGSLFEQCALLMLDGVILVLAKNIPDAYEIMRYRHTNMQ